MITVMPSILIGPVTIVSGAVPIAMTFAKGGITLAAVTIGTVRGWRNPGQPPHGGGDAIMSRQWFSAGLGGALALAVLMVAPSLGRAQMVSTVAVNSPHGLTFFIYPAEYTGTFFNVGPFGGVSVGLAPACAACGPVALPPTPVTPRAKTKPTRQAVVDLHVPANASVCVEGQRLKQTGAVRTFKTPLLQEGTYQYEVRVVWQENGRRMDETHQLAVRPGQRQRLLVLASSPREQRLVAGK